MATQNSGKNVNVKPAFINNATSNLMSSGLVASGPDGIQCTYRYAVGATAPVATPTDFILIQGSATKTCRIKSLMIGGAATAAGSMPVQIIRRFGTGGTKGSAVYTAVTAGKNDTANAAPTAVVSTVGTANVTTVQTVNGVLATGRVGLVALTSAAVYAPFRLDPAQSILLRGTNDFVVVSFNGAAVPSGGVIDFEIVIEEDNS